MKYTVELPKILCLMLLISKFAKDIEALYETLEKEIVEQKRYEGK